MIENHKIGVMQGRLLPKYMGKYQAHPVNYWQDEFSIASSLKLNCIEFILDYYLYHKNPLMTMDGMDQIKKCINETNVSVKSVCADYFMEKPFHHNDNEIVKQSETIMCDLIKNCASLNVSDIVVPCVDSSSLKNEDDLILFIENTKRIIDTAEKHNINLSLETDLNPLIFGQFLSELDSSKITVNYDTGNSASLGFNIYEEFKSYGHRISDIHIKDRKLNGGSVMLGEGDVNFNDFFESLKLINYNNPFIMQVYRDDEGINVFKKQLSFFVNKLNQYKI
jgi:sugar phosphate isomerase/epimerase